MNHAVGLTDLSQILYSWGNSLFIICSALISALKDRIDRRGRRWRDGDAVRHTTLVVMGGRGWGKIAALKIPRQWLLDVLVNADGSIVKLWGCGESNVMETGYITLLYEHQCPNYLITPSSRPLCDEICSKCYKNHAVQLPHCDTRETGRRSLM